MLPGNEDGIQVLAGPAQSSQTVGFLSRTPWLVKPDKKIRQKSDLDEFSSTDKYTLLLFIECIGQSQQFYQSSTYPNDI
jgi:hypothetical protein